MADDDGAHRWRPLVVALAAVAVPAAASLGAFARGATPVTSGLTAAAVAVGAIVTGFLVKVGRGLESRWLDRTVERIDTTLTHRVSGFGRAYRAHVVAAHRFLDLRGLGTQGPTTPRLDDVFIDVSLMRRPAHQLTSDLLPGAAAGEMAAGEIALGDRRPIWDFLASSELQPLAVVGAAGSGKTTLIKHMALRLARDRRRPFPVVLFLREHAPRIVADAPPLPELVRATLGSLAAKEPAGWFERQLDHGRCVVLLDGLDEVASAEHRQQVVDWVAACVVQFPRCQFALTSRPHGYRPYPLPSAAVLHVRPFTASQIERFVESWYLANQIHRTGVADHVILATARAEAADLLQRLDDAPAIYALAVNPLLLTMIVNVHSYRGALPGGRVELYEEICQVFLGKRQQAKGLTDDLRADQKELVLRQLAFHMMNAGVKDIDRHDAAEAIAETLATVSTTISPEQFLRDIEESSAVFVEREPDVCSFAHLTFQEFLAGEHIREHQGVAFLADRVDQPWWRETILLFAARADAGPIVAACLEPATPSTLGLALDVADEAQRLGASVRRKLDRWAAGDINALTGSSRRLWTQALLGRKARQFERLGTSDVHISRSPVTHADYDSFLQMAQVQELRWLRPIGTGPAPQPNDPVRGVSGSAAAAFAEWFTQMVDDGWSYRVPPLSTVEAHQPSARLGREFWVEFPYIRDRPLWAGKPVQRRVSHAPMSLMIHESEREAVDVRAQVVDDLWSLYEHTAVGLRLRATGRDAQVCHAFWTGRRQLAPAVVYLLLGDGDHVVDHGASDVDRVRFTVSRRRLRIAGWLASQHPDAPLVGSHRWKRFYEATEWPLGEVANLLNIDDLTLSFDLLDFDDPTFLSEIAMARRAWEMTIEALSDPTADVGALLRDARLALFTMAPRVIVGQRPSELDKAIGRLALGAIAQLTILQGRLEGRLGAHETIVLVRS